MQIINADVFDGLARLSDESVHCCVTSPPYWGLRSYLPKDHADKHLEIGQEPTLQEHIAVLVNLFREVRRVLRKDGTLWLNYGDAYAGSWGAQGRQCANGQMAARSVVSARQIAVAQRRETKTGSLDRTPGLKPKDLMMLPARIALALCDDGWWLRSEIIWHKPNPMPESVTDRPTSAHEKIYLLAKSERYFYDADAVAEKCTVPSWDDGSRVFGGINKHGANALHGERTTGRQTTASKTEGRNLRNVWTIATSPFPEAHFATFPRELAERCIKAGCPKGGTVLDPFAGAGTTLLVADRLGRHGIGIELNPEYAEMARNRVQRDAPLFVEVFIA